MRSYLDSGLIRASRMASAQIMQFFERIICSTTDNQYLLIYHLGEHSFGKAALYINGNLVRSEQVIGEEKIAIILDCPDPQIYTYIYMFLEGFGLLELKGIECYVL